MGMKRVATKKSPKEFEAEYPSSSSQHKRKKRIADESKVSKKKRADEDVSDKHCGGAGFVSKCRPAGLCDMVSILNEEQRSAINSIGGGILGLKDLSYIPWSKTTFFLKNFNSKSRILSFENGRSFVIREEDIHDLFMLPLGGRQLCDLDEEEYKVAFETFRVKHKKYGIDSVSALSKTLKEVIVSRAADDDLKILFVLYCLSSFLTPLLNQSTDLSLMNVLIDPSRVRNFNWCRYVLRRLCDALENFSDQKKNVGGCIIVLPILYFHRFQWQGISEPNNLPLIQHWTSKKFRIRLENEIENGGFGRGDFCEFAYPITRKNVGELLEMGEEGNAGVVRDTEAEDEQTLDGQTGDGQTVDEDVQTVDENVEACDASAKTGAEKGQQIFFNLPPSEKTNEEIHNIAKTPFEEVYLLFQRDLNIVTQNYLEKLVTVISQEDHAQSTSQSSASQSEDFFSSSALHRIIDEAVDNFKKKLPPYMMDDAIPTFNLFTPTPDPTPNLDEVVAALDHTSDPKSPFAEMTDSAIEEVLANAVKIHGNLTIAESGVEEVENIEDVRPIVDPFLATNEMFLDMNEDVFKSTFMKKNSRYLDGLSRNDKYVADFIFSSHESDMTKDVFLYNQGFYLDFKCATSLNDGCFVSNNVIDIWALLLNKKERNRAHLEFDFRQVFFFYTQHSVLLDNVHKKLNSNVKDKTRKKMKEKQKVDDDDDDIQLVKVVETSIDDALKSMRSSWMHCLEKMHVSKRDFKIIEKILIPIWNDYHFWIVAVDFVHNKFFYLDNRKYGKSPEEYVYWKVSLTLCEQFCIFLEEIHHSKAQDAKSYKLHDMNLEWQTGRANVDCAIFAMNCMDNFRGKPYSCDDLMRPTGRRKLRALYLSQMLLSPVNELKSKIEQDVIKFVKGETG